MVKKQNEEKEKEKEKNRQLEEGKKGNKDEWTNGDKDEWTNRRIVSFVDWLDSEIGNFFFDTVRYSRQNFWFFDGTH